MPVSAPMWHQSMTRAGAVRARSRRGPSRRTRARTLVSSATRRSVPPVGRPDHVHAVGVDQLPVEHIGREQHVGASAGEVVERGPGAAQRAAVEQALDVVTGEEEKAATDTYHQTIDLGVSLGARLAHDDVDHAGGAVVDLDGGADEAGHRQEVRCHGALRRGQRAQRPR
jgi:hypothetical protein